MYSLPGFIYGLHFEWQGRLEEWRDNLGLSGLMERLPDWMVDWRSALGSECVNE